MVAIIAPVSPAVTPHPLVAQATALGYPATLFGFTPEQGPYWREPGLPWLTHELWENRPLGRTGCKLIWDLVEVGNQRMGPRFPSGCRVNVARITERAHLELGKVYLYVYRNPETGAEECELGRLAYIGGNYLAATFDNDTIPSLWMLGERPNHEFRDVHEVTHYVSYPAEDEAGGSRA